MSNNGVQACRNSLLSLDRRHATHAGLLLQRYLERHKPKQREAGQQMPEEALIEAARNIEVSPSYRHLSYRDPFYREAFQRWKEWAQGRSVCLSMKLATPLAIGLGNASPLEVGLTLHHTYGIPIIPGSALKGLCRRGALRLLKEGKISQAQFEALFGKAGDNDAQAGYVTFYDALYDPDSEPRCTPEKPLHRDVITVHHPEYYRDGGKPPTDFDDPIPVPFLVIKPGACFLFVLDTPEGWEQFTKSLLQWCLCHLGVGAKTNAGYGYFINPDSDAATQKQAPASAATIPVQNEIWSNANLRYDRSKRILSASWRGMTAEASETETKQLLEKLPKEYRDSILNEGKSPPVTVEVERVGNKRKIVRIVLSGGTQ